LLVPAQDVAALSEALQRLAGDPALRSRGQPRNSIAAGLPP
jgi:hypothetical protein